MNRIIKLSLFLITLFSMNESLAQSFPLGWEGKWEGEVEIWNFNSKVDAFPMSLEISPTDTSWNFVINYQRDPNQPDVRNYSLLVINDTIGHYVIDEHNSILLDTYVYDNCLLTNFGGMGSELLMRACLEGEVLTYEISSAQSKPIRESGDTVIKTDTIPAINSYQVYNMMKARLSRK